MRAARPRRLHLAIPTPRWRDRPKRQLCRRRLVSILHPHSHTHSTSSNPWLTQNEILRKKETTVVGYCFHLWPLRPYTDTASQATHLHTHKHTHAHIALIKWWSLVSTIWLRWILRFLFVCFLNSLCTILRFCSVFYLCIELNWKKKDVIYFSFFSDHADQKKNYVKSDVLSISSRLTQLFRPT